MKNFRYFLMFVTLILIISGCSSSNLTEEKQNVSDLDTYTIINTEDGTETVVRGTFPDDIEIPEESTGEKTITVSIVGKDGESATTEIITERNDLLSALEESGLAKGSEEDPGYIITVNGYTADLNEGEWWQIMKNDNYLTNGADKTLIEDGDVVYFELQSIH